ncbi:hypothetical protein OIO90_004538 [Microbotryomycetes sp. JL221]|nr:hypothetical protein OIO90_004538 [Microbotryomycetes sp. JL221]
MLSANAAVGTGLALRPHDDGTLASTAATTTPLRPLELPPFSLDGLLIPVFDDASVVQPQQGTPSRLINQLLHGVTGSTQQDSPTYGPQQSSPSSTATTTSPVKGVGKAGTDASSSQQPPPSSLSSSTVTIRALDLGDNKVYIGANDGRISICHINQQWRDETLALTQLKQLGTTPSTAAIASSMLLKQVQQVTVTHGRKAADRIAILHRLDKAVVLSEGIMTFHSLPSLTPLSVHQFPAVRGCTTFSLDEQELAGGGGIDAMHICVVRRRSIHLLRVTNEGVTQLKDLPLNGVLMAVLRGRHVCTADTDNYSIVDLDAAVALPLLPISQSPNVDTEGQSQIDPRQRPAIGCVGTNEFLIASHTGPTTLGVFVTESGDPCRGTLEWASNLRSLVVDPVYSIALLHNNTIEVHSLHNQVLAQVVQLPMSTSPLAIQPRSLVHSWSGLDLGITTGAYKTELVIAPLLPRPSSPSSVPSTPKKGSMSGLNPIRTIDGGATSTPTKTVVVGKNSLHALTPMTLVAQADALFDKGRVEEAVELANQADNGSKSFNYEVAYVLSRAAFHSLSETLFQNAFELLFRARLDPRWAVRLFEDLRYPICGDQSEAPIHRGLLPDVAAAKTIDDFILENLNRNYSPHIKPDVETAGPTVEIRATLTRTARDSLLQYLKTWRIARKAGGGNSLVPSDFGSQVDAAVDTTIARLYAEQGQQNELVALLNSPNACVPTVAESLLREMSLYTLLADWKLKGGERSKVLEIWTKLFDGELRDAADSSHESVTLARIADELLKAPDKDLVERFGSWVSERDMSLGFKLYTNSKVLALYGERELLEGLRSKKNQVADLLLEFLVFEKQSSDDDLHAELIARYLDIVAEMLSDPAGKARLAEQENRYREAVTATVNGSLPPTFLAHLTKNFDGSGNQAKFDGTRLKLVLFLNSPTSRYSRQEVKSKLDELEKKGARGLTLERVIVYAQLQLDRQVLSLLVNTVNDLTTAEVYCQQGGDPLIASEVATAAGVCGLPESFVKPPPAGVGSSRAKQAATSGNVASSSNPRRRRVDLSRLLVELSLQNSAETSNSGHPDANQLQRARGIARILEAQAGTLNPLHVLSLVPDSWPLSLVAPYLSSTVRRSLHEHQELMLLKALAVSQNLAVAEKLGDLQSSMPPTVQAKDDGSARFGDGDSGGLVAKRDVIRLKPESTPPSSTPSTPSPTNSPGTSPVPGVTVQLPAHTAAVPLSSSSLEAPLTINADTSVHHGERQPTGSTEPATSSTTLPAPAKSVDVQLDEFFSQEWTTKPGTTAEILFIKRATRATDKWSGHVAFPGGRQEPEDEDSRYTAMRETWEEVGLDLAESDYIPIGALDDREITTSLGKRLLMILSPHIFLHTSPYAPMPELQESEVASAHWIPIEKLTPPQAKYGQVSIDISTRLAPKNVLARYALKLLIGKMNFTCILLPNEPVAIGNVPSPRSISRLPSLQLWGLTLSMTLDLLSSMKLPEAPPTLNKRQGATSNGRTRLDSLATYPHAVSTLNPDNSLPAMFAPSMASIFPRFAYPDINLLIWLFGYRYRRTINTPPHEYARVNWAGLSIGQYYASVRRALVVAVVLRAAAAIGGLSWLYVQLRDRFRQKRGLAKALGV